MLALRTVEEIDRDLKHLRNIIGDSVRDSDPWVIAWERVDELLEERAALIKKAKA